MRKEITTALFVGALIVAPAIGYAQTAAKPPAKPATAKPAPTAAAATHSTNGVVKSVDSSTLVITRARRRGDMTFTLDSSTRREGDIAVGKPVSVRYREEGKTNIATAVTVQQPKEQAARTPKKK